MEPATHLSIDRRLCGSPTVLSAGHAAVELVTTPEMVVDEQGLVHGGFVFGAVDHAAMLAVNDPNVVLGAADVRFVAPVRLGEVVRAQATVVEQKGRKRLLEARADVGGREVMVGSFTAFVLERHVLD